MGLRNDNIVDGADERASLILLESGTTLNTGTVENARTMRSPGRLD